MAQKNKKPLKSEEIVLLQQTLKELEADPDVAELGLSNTQYAKLLVKRTGIENINGDVITKLRANRYQCLRPKPEPEPEPEPETIDASGAIEESQWQGIILHVMKTVVEAQQTMMQVTKSAVEASKRLIVKIDTLDAKIDAMSALIAKFYVDCGGKIEDIDVQG